jgi:hypothetical protein
MDYFLHYDETNNRWHVCYRVPGTTVLSSVVDCPSEASARAQVNECIRLDATERASLERVFDSQRRLLPRRFNNELDD